MLGNKQAKRPSLFCFTSTIILLLAAYTAQGQVTASLTGTVVDQSGSAIPDAAVTVKSLETGSQRHTRTDASGNYSVLALPLGSTEVIAEKAGFKPVDRTG